MFVVLIVLAVCALLGLATGLLFRVWANVVLAPIIAFGSAIVLASHGFGFAPGVLTTVACLVASQAAYLVGAFMASRNDIAYALADDVLDDQPGDGRQRGVSSKQNEERREQPPRPPSLES